MQVFKVGVPGVWFKPFTLQGETWVCEFSPDYKLLCVVGEGDIYDMSQFLLPFMLCYVFFLFFYPTCRSCLASFGFLSEDLSPYIDFVCLWEEVECRILLHHWLELKPPF